MESKQKIETLQNEACTPFAIVAGKPVIEVPKDLYIPPQALEVFLETFEGPLDLLLYLIKRQNLDILNIPISEITRQYTDYIAMIDTLSFELAAEYLVMAAILAEIKSRILLPRVDEGDDDEADPRAELVRRLQEYERFKQAADNIDELPRMERDNFQTSVKAPEMQRQNPEPMVSMQELLLAFKGLVVRTQMYKHHSIDREVLSVRERMSNILEVIRIGNFCEFSTLFNLEEGRHGIVVSFLAVLELSKESLIDIVQSKPFAPIYVKPRAGVLEDNLCHQKIATQTDQGEAY